MRIQANRFIVAALACAAIGLASSEAHLAPPGSNLPQPWASLAWDTDVGRIQGMEADSEGPKSFALTPEGGVLILDQVNQRILELNAAGARTGELALPAPTFDDVEQFEGRAVIALDRLVRKTLLVLSRKGDVLSEVPVEGQGIERAGLITALLPRPDGVWLEVQHHHSVKVLDRELKPCTRQIVVGRPIVNGRSLHTALDGRGGVALSMNRRNARNEAPPLSVTLSGKAPIRRIVWSDVDAQGRAHAVLHEVQPSPNLPHRVQRERYLLVAVDDQLHEIRRTESPWVLTLYDQRVEFRLAADGSLWQMAFTPDGVRIINWGGPAK